MINKIKDIFDGSSRKVKSTDKDLLAIRSLEEKIKKMSEKDMQKRIQEMKDEVRAIVEEIPEENRRSISKINRRENFPEDEKRVQAKLYEFMPEVYAMMNESYRRTNGYTYHDVQLRAGILLARGQLLVEQYTGEGKTMTFQLPLVLYALAGRGSHLITVNEYLVKVGAEYAGHFLSKLGISVGIITSGQAYKFISDDQIEKYKGEEGLKQRSEQSINIDNMNGVNIIQTSKRDAYYCDVTYSTNTEIGFDYLRDNMAWDLNGMNQGELYFCVIDEADSILIDEARTPLIISATPSDTDTDKYTRFANAVKSLEEEKHYDIDHKSRSVNLTEEGMSRVEENLGVANVWDDFSTAYHLEKALEAKTLFTKDQQYIVRNGQVYIVDEFTGRVLEGRRYSEGLHQAIEAKEGVEIQKESKTFATITYQNFFRLYKVLAGGSGTVMTESEEFFKIYGLDSVVIPTNKPRIRKDLPDRIYKTQETKFAAVVAEIKEMNEIGRPVLVGTTSVEKSEYLSELLDREGIHHEVLNAKFHEQESRIVAHAGRKGSVTVATNMAGRGTDIVIGGGVRGDEAYQEVADLGGLHVIGSERHDARRIDNQLRGRTGRQGEPGSTRFYTALDDQIMRVLGGDFIAKMLGMIKVPDDTPIEMGFISKQIEVAQKRVENVNFDSRKSVVEYDDVMNQHREIFYSKRRNMLETAERALGRVLDEGKVMDLNHPENSKVAKKYEEKVIAAKEKLESIMEEINLSQIENAIDSNFTELTKYDEKELKKIVDKITVVIPANLLAKKLGSSESSIHKMLLKKSEEGENIQLLLLEKGREIFEEKVNEFDKDYYNLSKQVSMQIFDNTWVDHLEIMKDVRDSIRLQGYAQRNPIVEYKNKAYEMFESFIFNINREVTIRMLRLTNVNKLQASGAMNIQTNQDEVEDVLTGTREMFGDNSAIDSERMDKAMEKIERSQSRTRSNLKTNSDSKNSKKNEFKDFGRNDKVSVRYSDGTEKKGVKFKKVEEDLKSGKAVLI